MLKYKGIVISRLRGGCNYPHRLIGGRGVAKPMNTQVLGKLTKSKLQNLQVNQAIIGNAGLSGRKEVREPKSEL